MTLADYTHSPRLNSDEAQDRKIGARAYQIVQRMQIELAAAFSDLQSEGAFLPGHNGKPQDDELTALAWECVRERILDGMPGAVADEVDRLQTMFGGAS